MLQDFLDDLDDLDDEQEDEGGGAGRGGEGAGADDDAADAADAGADVQMADVPGVRAVSHNLLRSERLCALVARIDELLRADEGGDAGASARAGGESVTPLTEAHPEYSVLVSCNEVAVEIELETEVLVREVRGVYAQRFPELESLVVHPLDYARVVLKIGNETDLTNVELEGVVPAATVMVVTVTASTTSGTPLPPPALAKALAQCEDVLALAEAKAKILRYVESRMHAVAPNLTEIVGADVAARLIGAAGGLTKLAALPAGIVQALGVKRKTLGGLASGGQLAHTGFLMQCALVQSTPPALRPRVVRLVAGRCTLAARVDGFGAHGSDGAPERSTGAKFREEILSKLDKWQEPAPFKVPKALPVPEAKNTRKRGGARARKRKERTEMTDMRVQANRVTFAVQEESFGLDEEGIGTLGKAQSTGKVRLVAKQQKTAQPKVVREQAALMQRGQAGSSGATGGARGARSRARAAGPRRRSRSRIAAAVRAAAAPRCAGLTSTLAFTPVQGIELVNPTAAAERQQGAEGTETYFSRAAAFFSHGQPSR